MLSKPNVNTVAQAGLGLTMEPKLTWNLWLFFCLSPLECCDYRHVTLYPAPPLFFPLTYSPTLFLLIPLSVTNYGTLNLLVPRFLIFKGGTTLASTS